MSQNRQTLPADPQPGALKLERTNGLLSRKNEKHAVAQRTAARFKGDSEKGIKHTSGD